MLHHYVHGLRTRYKKVKDGYMYEKADEETNGLFSAFTEMSNTKKIKKFTRILDFLDDPCFEYKETADAVQIIYDTRKSTKSAMPRWKRAEILITEYYDQDTWVNTETEAIRRKHPKEKITKALDDAKQSTEYDFKALLDHDASEHGGRIVTPTTKLKELLFKINLLRGLHRLNWQHANDPKKLLIEKPTIGKLTSNLRIRQDMIKKSKQEKEERERNQRQNDPPTTSEEPTERGRPREQRTLWAPQRLEVSRQRENERNNYVRGRGGRGRGRGRNNVQFDPGFNRRELSSYEYRSNRNRNNESMNRNYQRDRTPGRRNSESDHSEYNRERPRDSSRSVRFTDR